MKKWTTAQKTWFVVELACGVVIALAIFRAL